MHDPIGPSGSSDQPKSRTSQPELDWAIATNFAYLRAGDWLPLLVEFEPKAIRIEHDETDLEAFTRLRWLSDDPQTLKDVLEVPYHFTPEGLPDVLKCASKFNHCVLLLHRKSALKITRIGNWHQTILRAQLGPPIDLPAPSGKGPSLLLSVGSSPPSADLPLTIRRTAVAVIDQGIAFANARFSIGGQTRISGLWQQDFLGTTMDAAAIAVANSPGQFLTSAAINAAMNSARTIGADEDWVYRVLGGLDFRPDGFKPLARRRMHGTHVLDLAASNSDASKHPIIAVDMPEDAVGDPAGSSLVVHAFWGLVYILAEAEALRDSDERLPVVVNISYGPHEGPHDGSSQLERIMDTLHQLTFDSPTPLDIVVAAGNFRQSRTHAFIELVPKRRKLLRWRLQPAGLTPSTMEIWLPLGVGNAIEVTLRAPLGTPFAPSVTVSPANAYDEFNDAAGNLLFSAEFVAATGTANRDHVTLSIARTALDPAGGWGQAVAWSGLWQVILHSRGAVQLNLHAWIRRSDTAPGQRAHGRQSYFDQPDYVRFRNGAVPEQFDQPSATSVISRSITDSGIATGSHTRAIGGFVASLAHPAEYSSQGPHLNATRSIGVPDWLEISDDSLACRGVLAAGTRSGSVVAMNGGRRGSARQPAGLRIYGWRKGSVQFWQRRNLSNPAHMFYGRYPPAARDRLPAAACVS